MRVCVRIFNKIDYTFDHMNLYLEGGNNTLLYIIHLRLFALTLNALPLVHAYNKTFTIHDDVKQEAIQPID